MGIKKYNQHPACELQTQITSSCRVKRWWEEAKRKSSPQSDESVDGI